MKGLYVNLSGSGVSLSMGVRGASVTMGKNGTYLNTGIPGTGIYSRNKISSSTKGGANSFKSDTGSTIRVKLTLDENGKPNLKVFDSYNSEIIDEKILSRIKRSESYKNALEQIQNEAIENTENEICSLVEIYKSTPSIIKDEHIDIKLRNLKCHTYTKRTFKEPIPDKEIIKKMLQEKAEKEIKKIFFWQNKALRDNFVQENLENEFAKQMLSWEQNKQFFIKQQEKKEIEENKRFENEYLTQKKNYENYLSKLNNENFINERIGYLLSSITLPVDFSIDYEFDKDKSCLLVDLDLPEIESMPFQKVSRSDSGRFSVKNKTKKEISTEYATCVVGIAFYFAGTFFNVACNIDKILISGYTQRINPKTGNIEDDYVYSILFDREKFRTLSISGINPIQAISNFENRISINASFELKRIKPLTLN
jgi:hypothetical protein